MMYQSALTVAGKNDANFHRNYRECVQCLFGFRTLLKYIAFRVFEQRIALCQYLESHKVKSMTVVTLYLNGIIYMYVLEGIELPGYHSSSINDLESFLQGDRRRGTAEARVVYHQKQLE